MPPRRALPAKSTTQATSSQPLGANVGAFWTFICSKGDPTDLEYANFIKRLAPQSLQRPVTDAPQQTTFLAQFTKNSNRLLRVLELLRKGVIFNEAVSTFIDVLLIPVADSQYREEFSSETFRTLMTKGIGFSCQANIDSNLLRRFFTALSRHEALIDGILLDKEATGLLLHRKFSQSVWKTDHEVTWAFLRRAAKLSTSCETSHSRPDMHQEFKQLETVHSSLMAATKSIKLENSSMFLPSTMKEPRATVSSAVPEEVSQMLADHGLGTPNSFDDAKGMVHGWSKDLLMEFLRVLPCLECSSKSDSQKLQTSIQVQKVQECISDSYETGMFCFGLWRIVCTRQAIVDLALYSRTGSRDSIEERFRMLASGDWKNRRSNLKVVSQKTKSRLPIFEARFGKDGLMLWNIHISYEPTSDAAIQVIKIWRIGTHKEVEKSLPFIIKTHEYHGDKYIKACKELSRQDSIVVPSSFSLDVLEDEMDVTRLEVPKTKVDHEANITDKVFTMTANILKGVFAGGLDSEFTFDLSKEETTIINQIGFPTFILGRSGTGKTTCLAFKLLSNYVRSIDAGNPSGPKQIFITRSQTLAEKLDVYIRKLVDFQLGRQDPQRYLDYDSSTIKEDLSAGTKLDLLSIKDDAFPLVCTFEKLLTLVRNTVNLQSFEKLVESRHEDHLQLRAQGIITNRLPKEVTYEVFVREYWDRLPPNKKGISVDLVFAEILGIIKGSDFKDGLQPLSRDSYVNTPTKLVSLFQTKAQRSLVYELYEHYEKRKKEYGDWDAIDSVRRTLMDFDDKSARNVAKRVRATIDEIYLDEVQDQRLIELKLLFSLVDRPESIHLAGDTAQCVSRDSTFRFKDVKTLLYSHFEPDNQDSKDFATSKPQISKLIHNYRSHRGIVSLSSSILDLLVKGFPASIDALDPEVGKFPGPTPLFLIGWSLDELLGGKKGLVGERFEEQTPRIAELGEDQVVITRDQDHKAVLSDRFEGQQNAPLILTILEAKGMEFDSVVINDFFSHQKQYYSHYRALESLAAGHRDSFDSMKHAVLCAELKSLYVAVTRCKTNLVFVESNKDISASVLRLWSRDEVPLVDPVRPEDEDAKLKLDSLRSGIAADPNTWKRHGTSLLDRGSYKSALQCFMRCNFVQGQTIAKAHLARVKAEEELQNGSPQRRVAELFMAAAELFVECGFFKGAAECFLRGGFVEKAADATAKLGPDHFLDAAKLYLQARCYKLASQFFEAQEKLTDAADALFRGREYDTALDFLVRHEEDMLSTSFRRYSLLLNTWIAKSGKTFPENRKLLATSLLRSDQEKEKFFREHSMSSELIGFLISRNRFFEARKIYFAQGLFEKMLRVAPLDCSDSESLELRDKALSFLAVMELDEKISRDKEGKIVGPGPIFNEEIYLAKYRELVEIRDDIVLAHSEPLSREKTLKVGNMSGWRFCQGFLVVQSLFRKYDKNVNKGVANGPEYTTLLRLMVSLMDSMVTVIRASSSEVPEPICILFGMQEILPRRGAPRYAVRNCSILKFEKAMAAMKSLTIDSVTTFFTAKIISWFFRVFDHGINLVTKKSEYEACWKFVLTGQCGYGDQCKFAHQLLTTQTNDIHITKIFAICVLACGAKNLISNAKVWGVPIPEQVQSSYAVDIDRRRGQALRFFMQRLLYVSAVDQDGTVSVRHLVDYEIVRDHMIQQFKYLRRDDNLWFERRGCKLLEDTQMARTIDMPQYSLHSFMRGKILYRSGPEGKQILWEYMRTPVIEEAIIFNSSLDGIHRYLGYLDKPNLQPFIHTFAELHALITLFERLSVFLVLANGPFDHLMLSSWVYRHYPKVQIAVQRSEAHRFAFGSSVRVFQPQYTPVLFRLSELLLRILEAVETERAKLEFGDARGRRSFFQVLGSAHHPGADPSRVLRRAMDLIFVNLYNLEVVIPMDLRGRYHALWKNFAKFLLNSKHWNMGYSLDQDQASKNQILAQPQLVLAKHFVESFHTYHRKENLLWARGRPLNVPLKRNAAFKSVSSQDLSSFFSISDSPKTNQHSSQGSEQDLTQMEETGEADTEYDLSSHQKEAGKRILHFFRLHHERIAKLRSFRRTPLGFEVAHVSEIIKSLEGAGFQRHASIICSFRRELRELIAKLKKASDFTETFIASIEMFKDQLIQGTAGTSTTDEFDAERFTQAEDLIHSVSKALCCVEWYASQFVRNDDKFILFYRKFGSLKEFKAMCDSAERAIQNLKKDLKSLMKEYKEIAGQEWKPEKAGTVRVGYRFGGSENRDRVGASWVEGVDRQAVEGALEVYLKEVGVIVE